MPERVLYICDWLPPDFGAVGQYSVIFARDLAAEGKYVVLAGLSSFGAEDLEVPCAQGRLRIIKFAAEPYEKTNLRARALWTIKTNTRLVWGLLSDLRSCDEIILTGSPPFLLHWIAPLNILFRKRLVYRITDFYPECLIAAQGRSSLWLDAIYRLTLFWRRRLFAFEALGEDQKARLLDIGIEEDRIRIKPDPSPITIDEATLPLERPDLAEDKVLLLYSGNWGVAHDYLTFLNAYREHHQRGSGSVVIWLNAVGAAVDHIVAFLNANRLPYLRGAPVSFEKLANLLVTPDAHLITLSDAFVGYVLPSKVHGCLASDKPILFVGSDQSDVHRLCLEGSEWYERTAVGDIGGCAVALERLAEHVKLTRGSLSDSSASSDNG